MLRIDKRQLGALTPLGKGGMAQVFRVGTAIPQLPGDLAYKELKPEVVDPIRSRMLNTIRLAVDLYASMNPAEQAELDNLTVWPLAMVYDKGDDVGLLMRCLPNDFFIDAIPSRRVFEFQLLSADDDQAKRNGFDKSRAPADKDLVRLALMARLAYAIEFIHRPRAGQKLVYGDLNLKNAAVAINPPRILLMDCDGVADVTDTTRVQPNTPFFMPPELKQKQQGKPSLQDQLTDVYKLGLCVVRGLSRGRGATQLADPASPLIPAGLLDTTGIDLLKRAVSADRGQRPTAEEIKDYLIGRVLDLADPPTLRSAQLSSHVVRKGFEIRVLWDHKGGKKVRVYDDINTINKMNIDASGFPKGYPIKPEHNCEIFVAVSNDHGEDEGSAGLLVVYDVPEPRVLYDAESLTVSVPDVPMVDIPEAKAKLPPYPIYPADEVPLPSLSWPKVPTLQVEKVVPPRLEVPQFRLDRFAAHGPLGNDLRDAIGHAYHLADAGIDETIGDILQRGARQMRWQAEQAAFTNPPPPPGP